MSLLTIIPTRSRRDQCMRLIKSFDETTDNADLLFVVDPDDESYEGMDWGGHAVVTLDPRGTMVQKLNYAAAKFANDYDQMAWYADDNEFVTPHWDTIMLETLQEMGGSGWVYSNDQRRVDIPETWLVSVDIVKTLGWLANPMMSQYYVADTINVLGKRSSLLRYRPDVIVRHHHYEVDENVTRDETYQTAESKFGLQDAMAWQAWLSGNQVSLIVSVLRRKFNPDVQWVLGKV